MKRTQRQFVVDIIEAMTHAEQFVSGLEKEELENDIRTQWALERAFGIIGEAAKKIDLDLKARYPELPWREITGMRDLLVHGYWMVHLDVVWETIRVDFPRHKPVFERILNELPPEEDLLGEN